MKNDDKIAEAFKKSDNDGYKLLLDNYGDYAYSVVSEKEKGTVYEQNVEECIAEIFIETANECKEIDFTDCSIESIAKAISRRKAINLSFKTKERNIYLTDYNSSVLSDEQKNRILEIIKQKEKLNNKNEVSVQTVRSKKKSIVKILSVAASMCVVCLAALICGSKINTKTSAESLNSADRKETAKEETMTTLENLRSIEESVSTYVIAANKETAAETPAAETVQAIPDYLDESAYKLIYKELMDKIVSENDDLYQISYCYYDMNNDGVPELITIPVTKLYPTGHDYKIVFYTIKNNTAVTAGEFSQNYYGSIYLDKDTGRVVVDSTYLDKGNIVSYVFDGEKASESAAIKNYDCSPLPDAKKSSDYNYKEYWNELDKMFDRVHVDYAQLYCDGSHYLYTEHFRKRIGDAYYFAENLNIENNSVIEENVAPVVSEAEETAAPVVSETEEMVMDPSETKPETAAETTAAIVVQKSDYKEIYKELLDTIRSENEDLYQITYCCHDMNGDGIPELITMPVNILYPVGHEYKVQFYSIKNNKAENVGEFDQNYYGSLYFDSITGKVVIDSTYKETGNVVSYVFDGETVTESDAIKNYDCSPLPGAYNSSAYNYKEYWNRRDKMFDLSLENFAELRCDGRHLMYTPYYRKNIGEDYYFLDDNN